MDNDIVDFDDWQYALRSRVARELSTEIATYLTTQQLRDAYDKGESFGDVADEFIRVYVCEDASN